jgi:hypothetical protein
MRSIIVVAVLGLLAVVPAAQAGRTASEPRVSVHLVDTTLKAVRNRGALRLHVTTDEPITIRVSVKRSSTTFAGGLNRVGAGGGNVTLKLTKAGRKLARKRSLRLSLVARASDAAQNKVSTKGSFTLG